MRPVFQAIKQLGGSGTVSEINAKVIEIAGLTEDQIQLPHRGEGADTEVEYRLHWARTYLKKFGVIDNSKRGVWALTPEGALVENLDPSEVVRRVKRDLKAQADLRNRESREELGGDGESHTVERSEDERTDWQLDLQEILLRVPPSAFERLVQRVLRESGFTQVTVTGSSGDGGIDGKGIIRLGGLLSFPVIFQAKRWKGSIGAKEIRDFRGAMVGRAEKGLFVTTGSFTPDAIREATRDGAPPIDLVDGDQLVNLLKELSLGVKSKTVQRELIELDRPWFESLQQGDGRSAKT
jgi:restriction system protein